MRVEPFPQMLDDGPGFLLGELGLVCDGHGLLARFVLVAHPPRFIVSGHVMGMGNRDGAVLAGLDDRGLVLLHVTCNPVGLVVTLLTGCATDDEKD